MNKLLSLFLFLFVIQATAFSQQDEYVIKDHEYIAAMGGSLDFNQFSAGIGYYTNLNDSRQIGTGLELTLFDYSYNFTNRTLQQDFDQFNLSYFLELRPTRAYYVEIPLVYAHKFLFKNAKIKVEGGITNGVLLGVLGIIEKRFEDFPIFEPNRQIENGWIAKHGFRNYTLRTNTSASYFFNSGMGFKLQVGIPILKMNKKAADIPSGEELFENGNQPLSVMIYFVCHFKKRLKTK